MLFTARARGSATIVLGGFRRFISECRAACAAAFSTGMCVVAVASALADDIDHAALNAAFQKYTSCATECAASLGGQILNESIDVGLKTVGAIKANSSAPDAIKYATFYVLLRSIYQGGKKIVGNNAACYNSCDGLNSTIVILGQSGLLGPMLKGGSIDESTFNNPKILDAYQKYLKPVQLPAEEKGAGWAKFISSLS